MEMIRVKVFFYEFQYRGDTLEESGIHFLQYVNYSKYIVGFPEKYFNVCLFRFFNECADNLDVLLFVILNLLSAIKSKYCSISKLCLKR